MSTTAVRKTPRLTAEGIADLAVSAMRIEADLSPKPGLVDGRGRDAHPDMDLNTMHRSAEALRDALTECALAARRDLPMTELRKTIGEIGRAGDASMLAATGGVNTHRGALWALGLLCAGAAAAGDATTIAAQLARLPDPALRHGYADSESHGARVRRRYGVAGATGEAAQRFPHVRRFGLPMLRAARGRGDDDDVGRLEALLAIMSHLDDTCLLHRGGREGLRAVRRAAGAVLSAGGVTTPEGGRRLADLDDLCHERALSPGGSGDLLSASVFLDAFYERTEPSCND